MTLRKAVLLLALLVASTSSSRDYRLPNNTKPILYNIKMVPHMLVDNSTFNGETEIVLIVLEPTFTITLHTHRLTYNETHTTLISEDGVSQNVTSHTYVRDKHFLVIGVQDKLPVGNYSLSLSFVGILRNDTDGFYGSSYTDASGNTVWFATTQFEPISARRAFPCYDEPALKAKFHIMIKHEPDLHALSNMPIAESYTDATDGKVWTVFETSPVMSTYLVAFVISDFSAIKSSDGLFNVWSRPSAISEAQYAHRLGSLALTELEDFTNVTYHLRKMDQISIPSIENTAMENWGLITYAENFFLYDESTSTLADKRNIAIAISHEFAHQWFGNLVSPAWWKYFWLKEGFATYLQYLITDAIEDNLRSMDQFVVEIQQATAFVRDSAWNSEPMNRDVASPSEVESKYNPISYIKAACVIRMTSHFLTEDVFKAGLTKYLNAHAFDSAVSDDLFEALQEAESKANILPVHVNVKDVMDTWVEQRGFPVVTVTRNYTTGTAEITQEHFLSEDTGIVDDHNYKWWIPINWASQASPDFNLTVAADWIRSQDESTTISGFDVSGWVILNKQQTGYYRVNYDDTNWRMIASYLNSDNYLNIHVLNRAALIDDAINLAKVNRLSHSIVLDLIFYLHREVDLIPWYPAIEGINHLDGLLANTKGYESFRAYIAFLTHNVFDSVGIEETDEDDQITRMNRAKIIEYACKYGLENCRFSAEAKLVAWLDDSTASPISPLLQNSTICAGLRSANATTWNKALKRYLTSKSANERCSLIAGLGCAEDEIIINTWLKAIINTTTGLNSSDSSFAIESVIDGSSYNVDRVLEFVMNNSNSIISYFGNYSAVQSIVYDIAYQITTDAQLEKLNTFIAAQSTVLRDIDLTTIDYTESNLTSNAAHQKEINTWIVSWLANLKTTGTTQEYGTTTLKTANTTEVYNTTILKNENNTENTYNTTTRKVLLSLHTLAPPQ